MAIKNNYSNADFRDYLYGLFSNEALGEFEDRLFVDPDLAAALDEFEHDLADAYIRREMSETDAQAFEKNYLNSDSRRARVAASRVLHQKLNIGTTDVSAVANDEPVSIWATMQALFATRRLVMTGLAVVITVPLIFLWWMALRPESNEIVSTVPTPTSENVNTLIDRPEPRNDLQVNENTNATQNSVNASNGTEIPNEANRGPRPETRGDGKSVFAVTLLPSVRSSDRKVIQIPESAKIVAFSAAFENEARYDRLLAEVRTGGGTLINRRETAAPKREGSNRYSVSVAAAKLKPGVYELALFGILDDGSRETINYYEFSVAKR